MKCFFCSTDTGSFEFLFCEDEERATQLFGIYIVLGKLHASKLRIAEIIPEALPSPHNQHLREALSWRLEGFASYSGDKGWVIRPAQQEFDQLSAKPSEGEAA